jgi:hypothetical protein
MIYDSDLTKKDYTQGEFLGMLEKRIRKHLRIDGIIDLKNSFVILKRDDVTSDVLMYFLENIFSKRMIIRFVDSLSDLKKDEIILSCEYLEEYIGRKLNVFFTNSNINILSQVNAPLRMISAKEINQVAEIIELSGLPVTEQSEFIEQLQKKYPQTKTSFLKSFDNIASELFSKR